MWSSSACAAAWAAGLVTSIRIALHSVLAVVSLPAPKREAGTKEKSRSVRVPKVAGSASLACRRNFANESGTSDGDFALRRSSWTRRRSAMFVAASSRPRSCTSVFQGATMLGMYLSQGNDSARYRPGTLREAEYCMKSSLWRMIFESIESILWP